MKFINYLTAIADIGLFPMISLFIFFIFFVLLLVFVFKADKKHISELANLPLE